MSDRAAASTDAARQAVWTAAACAAILLAGIAAWSNSFNGPFIFDDLSAIQNNPTLHGFPASQNFAPPHPSPVSRRPVVNLTFAINYAIGGLGVRGFHETNLAIHLLSALLLFGIVRRTLLTAPLKERFGSASAGLATAAALIWAVHPLITESVTYLTQRTELLVGLFLLLTLYCFKRAAGIGRFGNWGIGPEDKRNSISQSPNLPVSHARWWYIASIASCALGMASKEVMATAPIVVLLYDRCFLSGSFREALRRRRPFYLGLAATWAILGAMLIAYPWGGGTGAGFGMKEAGPWEYGRTQPGVILQYLRLSFWPSSLCLDYGWPIAKSAGDILPQAAVIVALLAATVWALRKAPALGFLGAWFFLILAPSSSFVPIVTEIAAERRMYLPLAAIVTGCVVAVWWFGKQCVRHLAESGETQKLLGGILAAAAVLCVAGALGRLTFERNADYRDAISIWLDTVKKQPDNAQALNNLGSTYSDAGHPDTALQYFDRAIQWNPMGAGAYCNRGAACLKLRRFEEAAADCVKAITLQPDNAEAYGNLATALLGLRRPDEALRDLGKFIELQPGQAVGYNNRAGVLLSMGQYQEALADCDRAIELQPVYPDAYYNRALVRSGMKEYDKALSDLKTYEQLGGAPEPRLTEKLLRLAGRMR